MIYHIQRKHFELGYSTANNWLIKLTTPCVNPRETWCTYEIINTSFNHIIIGKKIRNKCKLSTISNISKTRDIIVLTDTNGQF